MSASANIIFLIALGIYLIVFVGISIYDMKKVKTFTDYAVAGKKQNSFAVTMTLLATVIGASLTIGITDTVYTIGFPGIWWIVFGAVGLMLQSLLISEKVRNIGADTLPDMAGKIVGPVAEIIISLIIVISWVGVIAGQLVAMNSLITFATGKSDKVIFIIIAAIVIMYTIFGGQLSVVKTDKIQFFIIIIGVILCCGYLYLIKGGDTESIKSNIELLNDNYKPINLFTQLFVIGGVYFLGPDIISRNFISKDSKTAKKSALFAGFGLIAFALIITFIGMWVKFNISSKELGESGALMYVVAHVPKIISIPMIFGLLSAILSSTDTCIINASSIFVKDILKKDSIKLIRLTVAVIGVLAAMLALLGRGDIMALLTGAYSVYTPGVIFPLLIAILCYKKYDLRKKVWITAVILGGVCGILSTYFGTVLERINVPAAVISNLSLIGMAISLLISLLSVKTKEG